MENGRSYFFRDLIVKILLVLLFVFLLMWLFPMPDMNPLYDKIYTQNMTSMTDAAKSYFTVSRLPQKEGETKKLTLEDMINNKMIIEFTDSEGKKCNVKESYVEVTKKNGEYIFKTNLVCGSQSDYVIEYFGCYDVCEDGKCEVEVTEKPTETKKVTEYQFYKEVSTNYIEKYICKDGYTLEGTKCVLKTEVEKVEDASMKCLTGYSYNNKTNKCEKVNTTKLDATLSCPTGYVYASSLNKCIKGTENVVNANLSYKCEKGVLVGNKCVISNLDVEDATVVYSCTNGKLSGKYCIIDTTKEVEAQKVFSCTEGKLDGTVCIINNKKEVAAKATYSCTEGKLDGTVCIINNTKKVDAKATYSCKEGTLDGTKCKIENKDACSYSNWVCSNKTYTTSMSTSSTPTFTRKFLYQIGTSRVYEECSRKYNCTDGGTSKVDASVKYSCTEGTLDGTKCVIATTSKISAKVKYSCTEGTLNGTVCIIPTTQKMSAKVSYKCSEGTLNGTKCIINSKKEENAKVSYKCEKGTLNKDNKCEITTTSEIDATKVYSCTVGKLNGTKCEITGIDETDSTYTCAYGTLSGNKCLVNTIDSKNPIYYCVSGYTLAGTKCYITESATDIVDATPVNKTKTEKVYKWSTSEKLDGWIRTGKTRTSNVAITSKY